MGDLEKRGGIPMIGRRRPAPPLAGQTQGSGVETHAWAVVLAGGKGVRLKGADAPRLRRGQTQAVRRSDGRQVAPAPDARKGQRAYPVLTNGRGDHGGARVVPGQGAPARIARALMSCSSPKIGVPQRPSCWRLTGSGLAIPRRGWWCCRRTISSPMTPSSWSRSSRSSMSSRPSPSASSCWAQNRASRRPTTAG